MDPSIDPNVVELGVRLTEVAARNTANAVGSRIKAAKQGRDDKRTITEMNDLIYELLEEKQELELIAKSYQEEFVSQRLSEDDLSFISETVVPILKEFMTNIAETQEGEEKAGTLQTIDFVDALEPLLSINTLNVLQLIGFNFKRGLGEPLTELLKSLISGKNKSGQIRFNELTIEREVEYYKMMQDPDAYERLMSLR